MTTWTSSGLLVGAMCVALTACDDVPGVATDNTALRGVWLADGAVALVPPVGFCVDRRSLRANFAIMARCDTLGGAETFGAPLAVITATTVPLDAGSANTGAADETLLARRQSTAFTLRQVKGTPPSPEMRDVFWRSVGPVGDQALGLAIYQAAGDADLGEVAPDLLSQTMRRTKVQTDAMAARRQDKSATKETIPAAGG